MPKPKNDSGNPKAQSFAITNLMGALLSIVAIVLILSCAPSILPSANSISIEARTVYSNPTPNVSIPTSTIVKYNRSEREYDLVEVEYLDFIGAGEKKFLLFGARPCTECDAPRSVYIIDPEDGESRRGVRRYDYPGTIREFSTGALAREVRVFVGNCHSENERAFVYLSRRFDEAKQTESEGRLIRVLDNHLIEETLPQRFDDHALTEATEKASYCREIPPLDRQEEP